MTKVYRKHQKLPIREARWKWDYLNAKYQKGENITKYIESEMVRKFALELINSREYPEQIEDWVAKHLNPELEKKLNLAVRARRKRSYDNEKIMYAKKSVFLEYQAWKVISDLATAKDISLSEAILLLEKFASSEKLASWQKEAEVPITKQEEQE
ncbi:Ter macrodomain-binding protein MatP [Psittacicella gerlachiana]|uniref:MatP N-terminal domain-containing protein n=1 Tax=Psittacicella gerlachiana TaxID=2028574 RepID=A0A3A1Y740_9GAMM|nr:Ter macrodomain-binding protein MatP [Psittacicella gerlachiana]RIY33331.1 hypothetical protein CKF59_06490 [Psittacicella gerlachiana]